MQRHNRISDPLVLGLALATLTGCGSTSSVTRFSRGPGAGNLGSASEVVFAPTPAADGWEYARLDQALSVRSADELAQENVQRPDLADLRRITLQPRADQVYYFDPRHVHRRW